MTTISDPSYFHIGALIFTAIMIIWLKIEQHNDDNKKINPKKPLKDIRKCDLEKGFNN